MKKILITRHANASMSSELGRDFTRPLTDIGIKDCELIGSQLRDKDFIPDLSIVSSSVRTIQTYDNISKYSKFATSKVDIKESLYGIGLNDLINIIKMMKDEISTLMIVGHNPTMYFFSNIYSKDKIENFSTGSVALFSFDIKSWNLFNNNCELEYFLKPEDFK